MHKGPAGGMTSDLPLKMIVSPDGKGNHERHEKEKTGRLGTGR